jgi:outer membrane protein TolC
MLAASVTAATAGAEPAAVQLTLPQCLNTALANNRELQQGREAIRQVQGNTAVLRARYLPHVSLSTDYEASRLGRDADVVDQTGSSLEITQRLFEYGPDLAADVQAREDLRKAVYAYEAAVHQVLASVWQNYHLILLQDRQMAIRRQSRASFEALHEQQQRRYEARMSSESDVLQAYLNVLNDSLAINDLQRQQFNNKMALLRLVAAPIGADLALTPDTVGFALDQDRAVEIALGNSAEIVLATERLREQRRVVRELAWRHAPDLLALAAGVQDDRRSAGLAVGRSGTTWTVDAASDLALQGAGTTARPDQSRWFLQVQARVPLFDGMEGSGRELAERARVRQLTAALRDLEAATELQVRQAFQSVLEADGRQRIQMERARIAAKRLEVTQTLKDKGQVDETLLENFRQQFFDAQDQLFNYQATYIQRQADLRRQMGYFQ